MSIAIRKPRSSLHASKTKVLKPLSKAAELMAVNNLEYPQHMQDEAGAEVEEPAKDNSSDDLNDLISAIGRKCQKTN